MHFPDSWFEDEVRSGFYVPALMKRAWAAELEVLETIAGICEKYHIRWFAAWGTLLGAVRHSGFIPWDDDLDIFMLRDDYTRFLEIAQEELPGGYYIPRSQDYNHRLHTSIWNRTGICLQKEHLKKYHGYPFMAGVDIFPLDYLAPDPKDEEKRKRLAVTVLRAAASINEKNQDTEEIKNQITEIEELCHVRLNREQPLKEQLYILLEKLFAAYTAEEAQEVGYMPNSIFDQPFHYPVEYFQDPVRLPFEVTKIPVPKGYDAILKTRYGDYMTCCRTGSVHDYPVYGPYEKILIEAMDEGKNPFTYRFSAEDLKREKIPETSPKKLAADFTQLISKIHKEILNAMWVNDSDTSRFLLESCQSSAIRIGTMLEQTEGEKAVATVSLLEEYCELTWQIHESLAADSMSNADDAYKRLNELLFHMENRIRNDFGARREIVFLPWKASLWNSLESVWREAAADPECDVHVIPVPYFYRNPDGSFKEMQYEGNQFPEDVPIINYKSYNFKNRQPDMIFIHNPYDECNLTASVHPSFYSRNLKKYTKQLVYIPYFTLDESEPEDPKAILNMKYYVTTPGVVHADRVIVQSARMRQAYIDCLTQFAGEDTRSIWEEKIQGGCGHVFS